MAAASYVDTFLLDIRDGAGGGAVAGAVEESPANGGASAIIVNVAGARENLGSYRFRLDAPVADNFNALDEVLGPVILVRLLRFKDLRRKKKQACGRTHF